ncbi:hypothetical protein ACIQKE_25430 [Streptomyces griseoviridis]|uniref:hypothetical protein n=1 Tax=Streptomyces TaxID=1883 RepID=UPI0013E32712|nr:MULTISPECIES: hypothetical protein [Streptomyces]MDH6701476.1 type II secretory pathway pseudopilin PulG [Streptomyces sp. MAA16]
MDTAHIEGLIGMLTVLAILALLILPSVIGVVHERRIDRQLRRAARCYRTTTVSDHS